MLQKRTSFRCALLLQAMLVVALTTTRTTRMRMMVQAQDEGGGASTPPPSTAPPTTPEPNDCDKMMVAGDIYFTYVRSLIPNEVVMFLFQDIPGDMKLYLTDNAWTGTGFQSDEGTVELTVPAGGIPQGSNFGYGPNPTYGNDWVAVEGAFSLNPQGEQVFLYCFGATDVVPLAAISYNGPWQEPGLPSYGFNESALPERLATNGTITLEHCDTWEYGGQSSGQVDVLRKAMNNTNNWKGEGGCTGAGSGAVTTSSQLSSWMTIVTVAGSLLLGSIAGFY